MTIARILANKGREIITTQPSATLIQAAEKLSANKIGAVVVTDARGGVVGILSERDIIRAISEHGASALNDPIAAHMTKSVFTTHEGECVRASVERMTQDRFRHLPVIRDGRLVGLVSIGDIVKYRLEEMEHEHQALREYIATA
jgi:CBS domain-containing protein